MKKILRVWAPPAPWSVMIGERVVSAPGGGDYCGRGIGGSAGVDLGLWRIRKKDCGKERNWSWEQWGIRTLE